MAAQAVGSAVAEDESTVTSQRTRRQKASRKKGLTIVLIVCPLVTHVLKLLEPLKMASSWGASVQTLKSSVGL